MNRSLQPRGHGRIALEWVLVGILGMALGITVGILALYVGR